MNRIEWVKQRIENWALWLVRESTGGYGWATQSVLLANRVDESREAMLPIDETDAQLTHQAIESLRAGRGHLHAVLHCYYIKGLGIKGTAQYMQRAESTVKANLGAADHAVRDWFNARAEAKSAQRCKTVGTMTIKKKLST